MKVLRSSLVAAVAILAAACGDKVNVVGPSTADTTPKVNSVTVAPATAVMAVGQTVSFSAVVDVSNGAATTVNWSSSDANAVSMNGAVATAKAATPGVAICATSTVDANKKGCASVVVTAAATATPPSVSISSVNFTNGFGQQQPAPVPPGGIGGQINVVMNVNAGTAVLDSVVLKLGGKNAYKQAFTASQQAALAAAAMDPSAQAVGATITASVNTADYNTTTGAATWQNGNRAFQAFIYGKNSVTAGGSPTTVQGNSPAATYRLANADGFHLSVTYTQAGVGVRTAGETQLASAVDAAGYGWKSGGLNLSALFVQYTPDITPTNVTASFNNFACSAGGVRAAAMTNTGTGVAGPWTVSFSNTATAAATNVTAYEFNPAACGGAIFTSGGEIPAIAAVGSDNNNVALVAGGVNGGAGILNTFANSLNPDPNIVVRLDNVAPGGVTYNAQSTNSANANCAVGAAVTSMGGRTNCWFNDAVLLTGRQTGFAGLAAASTSTNGLIATAADLGSGRVIGTADGLTVTARVGAATDAAATVDANAAVTTVAGLAESATATTYRLRTRITDILGNAANSGSATGVASTTGGIFGVDRTAPGLAFAGGPAANAQNAAAGGAYTFAATDNSVAPGAPSGFFNLAATPLTVSSQRRDVVNGTQFWCVPGAAYTTPTTANACAGVNGWPTATTRTYLANLVVPDVQAGAVDAYYTISATVADQAGNVSPSASRVELVDGTASAIGGLSYPPFLTAGGAATFTSALVDNLDIQATRMNLQYGAIQPGANGTFAVTMFDANTGVAFAPTSALGGSTFWYPNQVVNGYNQATLVTTANMSNTVSLLYTNVQVTGTALGTNGAAVNAAGVLNTANGIVLNQANTPTASATPIIPGAIPAAAAITNTGLAGAGPVKWFICGTSGAAPAAGTACPAIPVALGAATIAVSRDGTTAGQNTVITLDAVATGTTGVFNNPFSSVQFWAYDPTAGANEGWRLITTVTNSSTVTDGGAAEPNGRNWHFIANWDPSATDAPDAAGTVYKVVAIGVGGANLPAAQRGMALATPLGGVTLTINP
jgi:hypothetical protein